MFPFNHLGVFTCGSLYVFTFFDVNVLIESYGEEVCNQKKNVVIIIKIIQSSGEEMVSPTVSVLHHCFGVV